MTEKRANQNSLVFMWWKRCTTRITLWFERIETAPLCRVGKRWSLRGLQRQVFGDLVYVNQNCKKLTIDTRMPVNRAGHTDVSAGSETLVCGGYDSKTAFVGNGKNLECWWFTPLPYPGFDTYIEFWNPHLVSKAYASWVPFQSRWSDR